MIRIPTPKKDENPPNQAFQLSGPRDMLIKLRWELISLRNSLEHTPRNFGESRHPAFHAYNCAVTAWHMTDWVWNSLSREERKDIAALIKPGINEVQGFQHALAETVRPLYLCKQIANGSKHRNFRRADPDVQAVIEYVKEPAKVGTFRAGDPLAIYKFGLMVRDGEHQKPAIEVFHQAYKFWETSLGEWGIIEDRFIGPETIDEWP